MVAGEAIARMNSREGDVAVFPLWPSCLASTEEQRQGLSLSRPLLSSTEPFLTQKQTLYIP
jgi:hypothetical protein